MDWSLFVPTLIAVFGGNVLTAWFMFGMKGMMGKETKDVSGVAIAAALVPLLLLIVGFIAARPPG